MDIDPSDNWSNSCDMSTSKSPNSRTRLSPADRERQIVAEAVKFFSEVGFGGQTRELARRLGITQGLLYRYFPDKQSLLERVYAAVFEEKWKTEWVTQLQDRSLPLRDRLLNFYSEYRNLIQTSEWVRTYLLAGLAGLDINQKYRELLKTRLFPIVVAELRFEFKVNKQARRVMKEEEEHMLTLHGMIFYQGIRKWVYRYESSIDEQVILGRQIDMFLFGTRLMYGQA